MTRVRCLLTAIDAKERQLWVNRLRATAEYHTASMAPVRSDDGGDVVSNSVIRDIGRTGVWGHYKQPSTTRQAWHRYGLMTGSMSCQIDVGRTGVWGHYKQPSTTRRAWHRYGLTTGSMSCQIASYI